MSDHTDGCSYQSCTCKLGPMTAEQHAMAILNAIQTSELAGFMVEVDQSRSHLTVADVYVLAEPLEEDEPWDMVASG